MHSKCLVSFPPLPMGEGRGEGFREGFLPQAENKETPDPVCRKRLRKGTRGQHGECAVTVSARQTYFFVEKRDQNE